MNYRQRPYRESPRKRIKSDSETTIVFTLRLPVAIEIPQITSQINANMTFVSNLELFIAYS